jgi:hypothetical protein
METSKTLVTILFIIVFQDFSSPKKSYQKQNIKNNITESMDINTFSEMKVNIYIIDYTFSYVHNLPLTSSHLQ